MFKDLLNAWNRKELFEATVPRRTFADVILPAGTRRALDQALVQIRKHDLIYNDWGLGERHEEGIGLAFNFAGPPGTGKTICAEAIANQLGRRLYKVKYSEIESMWAGETSKNIASVFREAKRQNAVLFFDEADSIASRRFTHMGYGYEREANQAVNVLLAELEIFEGVIIFATNLASNFDPAFERRIRTHILFTMPGVEEREKIWKVQLHPRTPLDDGVDFTDLARRYDFSGGDIKNAVLKAALLAAGEAGSDSVKRIHQRHFLEGAEQVIASRKVMEQSVFDDDAYPSVTALQTVHLGLSDVDGRLNELAIVVDAIHPTIESVRVGIDALRPAVDSLREDLNTLGEATNREMQTLRKGLEQVHRDAESRLDAVDQNILSVRRLALYYTIPAWIISIAVALAMWFH